MDYYLSKQLKHTAGLFLTMCGPNHTELENKICGIVLYAFSLLILMSFQAFKNMCEQTINLMGSRAAMLIVRRLERTTII